MRHWVMYALSRSLQRAWVPGLPSTSRNRPRVELAAGVMHGEVLSLNAPPGTLTTEANAAYKAPSAPAAAASTAPAATAGDWPSYNRTLTSERVSDLSQINTQNVSKLKVLCDLVGSALIDNFLVLTTSNI